MERNVSQKDDKTMQHIMDTSQKVHQYMESIQDEIDQTLFVAQSDDESVSVSLNGKHQLIDMQISSAAMKLSAHDLSQAIIQTHEQALLQISNATRQKILALADKLSAKDD